MSTSVYLATVLAFAALLLGLVLLVTQASTRPDMNERICAIYVEFGRPLPSYCDADDLNRDAIEALLRRGEKP